MAFIENFLVPLSKTVISLIVSFLILIGFYFLIVKFFGERIFRIRMWFKYRVMKKSYDEDVISWVLEMIENKIKPELLMRYFYMTNQFSLGEFKEAEYIYYKIKQMDKM